MQSSSSFRPVHTAQWSLRHGHRTAPPHPFRAELQCRRKKKAPAAQNQRSSLQTKWRLRQQFPALRRLKASAHGQHSGAGGNRTAGDRRELDGQNPTGTGCVSKKGDPQNGAVLLGFPLNHSQQGIVHLPKASSFLDKWVLVFRVVPSVNPGSKHGLRLYTHLPEFLSFKPFGRPSQC